MSRAQKRRLVLAVVATDTTFVPAEQGGFIGRCLHCNAHLWIREDGEPVSRATLEHIVPQHHGGTDALRNLGLACARCNHGKGARHDRRRRDDPKLVALIESLQRKRDERWRDPPDDLLDEPDDENADG